MKSLLLRLCFCGFLLGANVQANVIDFRVGTEDIEVSQSEDNYQEFSAGKGGMSFQNKIMFYKAMP